MAKEEQFNNVDWKAIWLGSLHGAVFEVLSFAYLNSQKNMVVSKALPISLAISTIGGYTVSKLSYQDKKDTDYEDVPEHQTELSGLSEVEEITITELHTEF